MIWSNYVFLKTSGAFFLLTYFSDFYIRQTTAEGAKPGKDSSWNHSHTKLYVQADCGLLPQINAVSEKTKKQWRLMPLLLMIFSDYAISWSCRISCWSVQHDLWSQQASVCLWRRGGMQSRFQRAGSLQLSLSWWRYRRSSGSPVTDSWGADLFSFCGPPNDLSYICCFHSRQASI